MASDKAHPKKYSCKSCLKDFSSEFMLRKHNSYFHRIPDNPYRCVTCNKTFPQLSELKSHVKVHTSTLKCGGCGGKVSSPEELKKHSLCWSRDCTVCGKAFDQIDELEAHSYTHTGEKPFKCSTCGDGFPSEELLQEHASSHTGPIFECSQCDAVFNEAMALKKHELNHLRPLLQTRVTCSWCGDEIKTKLMGRHRRLHKRQNSYECSVCQDVFEEPVLLKEHLSSHAEEESYICPVCDHYFTNVNLLKEHICISEDDMSDTYSEGSDDINDSEGSDVEYSEDLFEEYGLENDEDPYLWNDDYISEEQDLQNDEDISQELGLDHESVLENGENIKEEDNYYQDIDIDESVLPGEQGYFHTTNKTYICPLCFLKFTDLSDFNLHMEECSDDLLHTCSVCASGFPTENLLNDHSVPKKCPICCERFDCALLWKVHSYNHPEYGSYKCSLCSKQFQFRSEIMEHSLTHKSYRCPDCVTEFDTVIMLHRHACKARKQQDKKVPDKSVSKNHTMDQQTENQLPCPVCKTPFKSVTDFEEHMESHKEEKLVNCIFCGRFLPPFKRAHHIIACGKKKKRFFVDQDSTVKTTTASEPVVQATDGQSINSQTPSLEAATKPDESIAQKPDKEPIISDQHKETTETSNVKKPRKSSKKIQLCSKCGETFPDSKLLRLHMYDHIYKPCPNCGMVFALEKLKKHAVICTVKKVNNLEVKSSDFKKPAVIPLPIVNQQIHPPASRETVYKCSDCSMKCSSKSVLKEHSYLHKCYVRLEDCQQRHDKEKTHEIKEKKVESATEDKEDEKDILKVKGNVASLPTQEQESEIIKEIVESTFPTQDRTGIKEKEVESASLNQEKAGEIIEEQDSEPSLQIQEKEGNIIENKALLSIQDKEHEITDKEHEPAILTEEKENETNKEIGDKLSIKIREKENEETEKVDPPSQTRKKKDKISKGQEPSPSIPTHAKEDEITQAVLVESSLPIQKKDYESIKNAVVLSAAQEKKDELNKEQNLALSFPIQEKGVESSVPSKEKENEVMEQNDEHSFPTEENTVHLVEAVEVEPSLPNQRKGQDRTMEKVDEASLPKEVEGEATIQEKLAEPSTPARRKGRKISVKKTALPTQEKEEEVKENKIESTPPPQKEVNEIIGEEADKAITGNKKEVEGKATNQEKSAEPSTPARGKGKKRTVKKKTALPTQEKEDELKEKEIECTHPPQSEVNVIIGEEADKATTANKKEVVVTIQEKSAEPSTPTRGKRRRGTMEKKATLPTPEKEDEGKDRDIECTLPPQKEVNETIREEADKAASLTANEKESEGDVTIQKKSNEPSNQARGKRSKRNVKKKTTLPTQEKEEEVKEKEIEFTLPPQKEVNEIIGEEADKAATGNKKEVEEEATIQEKSAEPSTPIRRKRRRGTVEEKATLPTPEKEDEGNEKDIECTLPPQKEVNEMIGEEVEKAGTANKKEVEGEATIQEKSAEPSTPTRVMRSKRNVKKTTTLLTQEKEEEVKEKDIVCTLPPQREINAIIEEKPDKAVALTENEKESEGDVTLQEKSSEPPTPIRGKRSKRNVKRKTALATQEKEEEIKEKGIESTLPPQKEVNEIIGEKADKAPAPTENEKDMEEEVTIQEKSDEPSFQTRGKRRRRTVEKKTTLPAQEKEDVFKEKEIECTLPPQKEVNEMIGEIADKAASPAENEKEKEVTIQEKSDEPSTPARGKRRRRTVGKTTPPTQEKQDERKEKEIECTLPLQKEVNEMIAGEADGAAFPTENEKEFKEEKEPEVSSLTKEKEVEIIKEKGSNNSLHACEEINEMKQERVDEVAITNHETDEKIVKKKKDNTCFSPKKKRHKIKQEKVDGLSITPHENETLASPTEKTKSCSICGERFENLLRLRIHATIHKYESCALCGKVFIKERLPEHLIACIVEHFDSSEIAESLSSSRPDRNFVDVDASAEEERPTHPSPTGPKQPHPTSVGPTSHTCSACDMQFSELEHLEEHIRIHKCYVKLENCSPESSVRKVSKRLKGLPAGERHICLDCGIGFKESSDLWKHEDVHKMKPCSQCGELFSRREIREHSLDCTSVRPPKEGVSVSPCTKYNSAGTAPDRKLEKRASPSRSSGSTLSPHKANHIPANTDNVSQKCPQCDKQFDDEPTLKNHILITHEQNQVHTCSNCKMNFSQPHLLEEHRLFHKNCSLSVASRSKWRDIQQKSEPASDDLTQSEKKPSICTCIKRRKTSYIDCRKCVKGFTDVGDLTDHVNKHSIWECSS